MIGLNQKTAFFILGLICGAILCVTAIGYRIDQLHQQNIILEAELNEGQNKIITLEEKVSNAQRWLTVQEIIIEIDLPDKIFSDKKQIQLILEKQIKEILQDIRGKKIQELDAELVRQIINNRYMEALGYQFTLELKSLILAEKSIFLITAHNHPEENKGQE